ncbi:MAG: hypothetical protein KHW86_09090 [Porphyromonadaceae bacterium]|nr:hypothetical protein [Porphyromonadaceae bacterium]
MNKNFIVLFGVYCVFLFCGCAARVSSGDNEQRVIDRLCRDYVRNKYQVLPGMPDMREQIAMLRRWERDSSCILIPATAKGTSYNIAKIQAENQAKIELTGRLASRVATLSKVNTEVVDEGEYGGKIEHQTTVESKIIGSSSLKNLVYIMELFRVLKSGETEVILVLGYQQ